MEETQRLPGNQPEPHCSESDGTPRSAEIHLVKLAPCVAPGSLPVIGDLLLLLIICMCMVCVCGYVCVTIYTCKSEDNFMESVPSFQL